MLYYIIAATIPEGHREGENVFASAVTTTGLRVCAKTAVDEFPGLFFGRRLTLVELTCADFPVPVPLFPLL